jgi:hypothetical protein
MVIKDNLLHTGWSYGNGDDQYDNESIGSTKTAVELKKSMENTRKNKKNEQEKLMGNNNSSIYTNEQGWTTIEVNSNSNRKPKSKISKQSSVDSIISTINVDFNILRKGAPEAKIDSPLRENRCTVPDGRNRSRANEFNIEYQSNQKLIPAKAEETGEETADQNPILGVDKNKSYEQGKERDSTNEAPRSNKAVKDKRQAKVEWKEQIQELTPTSKGEEETAVGYTKMAINGSSEVNQNEMSKGEVKENNNGNQMNDEDNQGQNRNKDNQEEKKQRQ